MGLLVPPPLSSKPPPPPPPLPPKKAQCICLEYAGMLNFTYPGKPIGDCQVCHGTGKMDSDDVSGKMDSDDVFGPAGEVFDLGE